MAHVKYFEIIFRSASIASNLLWISNYWSKVFAYDYKCLVYKKARKSSLPGIEPGALSVSDSRDNHALATPQGQVFNSFWCCRYTVVPLFFMSKIIHVYLFRGILFSFFSILMKIFEHRLFFSFVNEEVYSEVPFAWLATFQGYRLCYCLIDQWLHN